MKIFIGVLLVFKLNVCNADWIYTKNTKATLPNGRFILNDLTPDEWYKLEPACHGHHQSPIHIKSSITIYDQKLKQIEIVKSSKTEKESWEMDNNGKTGHFIICFK